MKSLETDKKRLLSQNTILRQTLKDLNHNPDAIVGSLSEPVAPSPSAKRKKRDTESSDEGISLGFDEVQMEELRKEVVDLRLQLEQERRLRHAYEARFAVPPPPAPEMTSESVKVEVIQCSTPSIPVIPSIQPKVS